MMQAMERETLCPQCGAQASGRFCERCGTPSTGTKRVQWEYLRVMWCGHNALFGDADNVIVSVSDGRLEDDRHRAFRHQDGHKEIKISVSALDSLFAQLGGEGWDLINVCSNVSILGSTGNAFSQGWCIAYFKRTR
jgi:hypothetical protein